ncbi:hypothetical protein GLUCOINTEAF2_0202986 [Komagataeibacter intermedius AF2]|uniref:Uncharacterized protein n=1 Tax=Komagataeibacter intermedius AF2 TaxID=1458464 RepID=A0A0N1N5M0_9PROT|nr:hypothetical protein [Komagataeibacter intermedius]KPH86132.1 hypothetical protein GLUCOINTEAF2_0202986 [Komagataeibacter intermedius AF2]
MTTTSERVVEILVQQGKYRELAQPVKIGSLSFEFDHALVASERANDLVIVIELKSGTSDEALIRKVLALTRALDVLKSKRSVTAVLTSGQALPETVQSISRVCRVLPIGTPVGPKAADAVRDWLSVLLPISQPATVETLVDWTDDLRREIPKAAAGPLADLLVETAPLGKQAVEDVLADAIKVAVEPALAEGEDDA